MNAHLEEDLDLVVQLDPDTEEILEEWPLDFRPLAIAPGPGR